jgi:hypothetical protein
VVELGHPGNDQVLMLTALGWTRVDGSLQDLEVPNFWDTINHGAYRVVRRGHRHGL